MIIKRFLPQRLPKLTPAQSSLWKALIFLIYRFYVVASARRSGKTMLGKKAGLVYSCENSQVRGFYGAPTEMQAKGIFWEQLKRETKYLRTYKNEAELSITLRNGSYIRVVGLDKPERVEGQPWDWFHVSEAPNCPPDFWGEHLRPMLSEKSPVTGRLGWGILEGTPEGLNHFYELALIACDGVIPITEPLKGAFAKSLEDPDWAFWSWFTSDVQPPEEVEKARNTLDERTFLQEYMGQFLGAFGRAYYTFTERNIKKIKYNREESIHGGIDFNVNPMTCTIGHIRGKEYHQFDEMYLRHSNTRALAESIIKKFPEKKIILENSLISIFTRMLQQITIIHQVITQILRYYGNTGLPFIVLLIILMLRIESIMSILRFVPQMGPEGIMLTKDVNTRSGIYNRFNALMTAGPTKGRKKMALYTSPMPWVILFATISRSFQISNCTVSAMRRCIKGRGRAIWD